MTAPSTPTQPLRLKDYAAQRGIPLRTAQQWADQGRFDGSSVDRPHAYQDAQRRWWVVPGIYREVVEVRDETQTRTADQLAALFERMAADLRALSA